MKNAVFYAMYLPHKDKSYTVEHFFKEMRTTNKKSDIYVGIQSNSIKDTERIVSRLGKGLRLCYGRVRTSMTIDSDASSFLRALELYIDNGSPLYDFCYFAHSKGVTTGYDSLREFYFRDLFDEDLEKRFAEKTIGSFGPSLTIPIPAEDISKLSCMKKFNSTLIYDPMHYFYAHTFYVIRGFLLKSFIDTCNMRLFTTNINSYSDRYMFERDFSHIVDMQGFLPSYKNEVGNYHTGFRPPSLQDVYLKLSAYLKGVKEINERLHKRSNNIEK